MESPMNNAMMRLMVLLTKSNVYCYLDNLTDAVDGGIYRIMLILGRITRIMLIPGRITWNQQQLLYYQMRLPR